MLGKCYKMPLRTLNGNRSLSAKELHDDRSRLLYAIPGHVPQVYGDMAGCRFSERCPLGDTCPGRNRAEMAEIAPGHLSRCQWAEGGKAS